jgi:hypothetical protein
MLGSLYLRTRGLHVHLWVDEGLSVGIARHPLSKIPHLLREDGSPPLYYVLLHIWMQLRGHSEVATHELSLIFALLMIPLAYWAGSTLFDRRTAMIAAIIAAFVPYLTGYGQETRMYTLMAVFSLLVAMSFVLAFVRRRRGYLALFVVSMAGCLYTHNWGLFLAFMCAVAFLICVRHTPSEERRGIWRDGVIAFVGVLILYGPWLPTLLYQSKHTGAPWALPPVIWSLSQGMYYLVGGRGAAMLILIGAGGGILALDRFTPIGRRLRFDVLVLGVLGLGTLVLAWLYAKHTPAWAFRYLAAIIGPLLLLAALGFARGGRLALVTLALATCFWIIDPVPHSPNSKSNVASALDANRPHFRTDPLVLSTQPEQVPTIFYYMRQPAEYVTPLGRVPIPGVMDWRDALTRFRHAKDRTSLLPALDALAPGQRVILVTPINFPKAPLWMKLINRSSHSWTQTLKHDPKLFEVSSSALHGYGIGSGVNVTVFAQRS